MTRSIDWLRARRKEKGKAEKNAPSDGASPSEAIIDDPLLPVEEESQPEFSTPEDEEHLLVEEEEKSSSEDVAEHASALAEQPPEGDATSLAARLLAQLSIVLRAASERKQVDLAPMRDALARLVDTIAHDEEAMAEFERWLAHQSMRIARGELGTWLQKSLATLLYAIKIGKVLGWSDEELRRLALLACLHHVGLVQLPKELQQKEGKLSDEERAAVQQAWEEGAQWLASMGLDDARILRAIRETPERIDGSGPKGLKGAEISTLGRLIGLLSMFESLVHYRPWRKRLLPRDAVRMIIKEHKQRFELSHLKALIDAISLYPVGTWVQLNSGDFAEVVRVHPRHPLRPVVETRFNRQGEPVQPRRLDLLSQPNLRIERCMYPEDVPRASS